MVGNKIVSFFDGLGAPSSSPSRPSSTLDFEAPSFSAPELPSFQAPSFTAPDLSSIKPPSFSAPDLSSIKAPDMSSIKAPDMSKIGLPVGAPEMPDLSSLKLPAGAPDLSSIKAPDLSSIKAPDLSSFKLPAMPKIDLPSLSLPDMPSLDSTLDTLSMGDSLDQLGSSLSLVPPANAGELPLSVLEQSAGFAAVADGGGGFLTGLVVTLAFAAAGAFGLDFCATSKEPFGEGSELVNTVAFQLGKYTDIATQKAYQIAKPAGEAALKAAKEKLMG